MDITGITTISVTKLQSRLAQTLRWSSQAKRIIKLTHWFQPTHVIIPISYLPKEVKQMLSGLPEDLMDGEVVGALTDGITSGTTIQMEQKTC